MVGGEDLKAENYSLNSNDTVCLLGQLKKFLAECLSIPLSQFGLQSNRCAIQQLTQTISMGPFILSINMVQHGKVLSSVTLMIA